MDHPFGERLADAAALKEAGHHAAGDPVVRNAAHRADQRIAVGREGEGAVDPALDAGRLQAGIAAEAERQLVGDTVGVLLDQLDAVVPRRAIHVPVLVVDLVDAEQQALLLLAHIGETLEVDDQRQFAVERLDLWQRLGDEIVVLHRRYGKLDARHPADLLGPQAGCVDHVLGDDGAFLGDHVPAAAGPLAEFQHPVVLDDLSAAQLRGLGIGVDDAGRVDVAFALGVEAAEHAVGVEDGAALLDLVDADQMHVVDAHGLEDPVGGFQPFPALGRGGHRNAAGHVHADVLAGFLLDLRKQVDRVGLQCRDVGIGIQRVEAARRVPARSGGHHVALDQRDIAPAEFRKMVEHRGSDHAAADDHRPIMGFHVTLHPFHSGLA